MKKLKQLIKPIVPKFVINRRRLWLHRFLIQEINKLEIETVDNAEDFPSVSLKNGKTFFGLRTDPERIKIFEVIKEKIACKSINKENFGVVFEIVSRYLAPRSLPGELVRTGSKYDLMRDPLNDLKLNDAEKVKIANMFSPKKGDVILDVGACHGYGSMRLSEYVEDCGKVIVIEANPVSANIIRKNIKANSITNIVLIETALSSYNSDRGLFYVDGVATGNSLRPDVLAELGISNLEQIQVPIASGDSVLKNLGVSKIQYLNITVNGGEPEVLDGLKSTIDNSERLSVTMPGWYFRDGHRLDALLQQKLESLGFKFVLTGKMGRVIAWK